MISKILKAIKAQDLYLLTAIIFAIFAGHWLLKPGYFNMHDDLQMMRQLVMEECFKNLQIPCRWTQYMGYGFGFPLFNYYPPLPYLVGEIWRILGLSFVTTVKLTFLISFIGSGITMYFFAREFFGKLGGLLSSIFYVWAPYHSVDVFVRGAMNEAWAFIWFPLSLLASYKIIKNRDLSVKWLIVLVLSWFGLFTTHNLMVMIFTPVFATWILLWLAKIKVWKRVIPLFISGLWGLGLAAFFTIPVLLEKNLVHVETLVSGYYEYIAHFVTFNQLFISRFWGYGPSIWGPNDGMSFQIGYLHWLVPLAVITAVGVKFIKTGKVNGQTLVAAFFFFVALFAAFMTHNKSTFIWQKIAPLEFVQFPWRFLTLVVLGSSMVAGALIPFIYRKNKKLSWFVFFILAFGVVILNKDYFKPLGLGQLTDQEKFSGAAWQLQQTAGIYDYLPKTAYTAPKRPQDYVGKIIDGNGEVKNEFENSKSASFTANIFQDNSVVELGIFQFPGWKVFIDGKETKTFVGNDVWGRMHITVSKGQHKIVAKFTNTPIRTIGNLISLVSWLSLLVIILILQKNRNLLAQTKSL